MYKDDLLEVHSYHPNGNKSSKYYLREVKVRGELDQLLDGVMKKWDEKGKLIEEITYFEGVKTKLERY